MHRKGKFKEGRKCGRKYGQDHHWQALKKEHTKYKLMLKTTKKATHSEKIKECGKDSKKLYKFVSNITGTTKTNPMPMASSDEQIANEFAEFFIGKINKIRDDLDNHEKYTPYSLTAVPSLEEFEPLQEIEVIKIVKAMATKSCEMDVLPTTLLKDNLDHLIGLLTKLVNTSLEQGVYAKSWKTAIVRPLLKKTGLELIYSNFRPVSNLPFISKLVELLHAYIGLMSIVIGIVYF